MNGFLVRLQTNSNKNPRKDTPIFAEHLKKQKDFKQKVQRLSPPRKKKKRQTPRSRHFPKPPQTTPTPPPRLRAILRRATAAEVRVTLAAYANRDSRNRDYASGLVLWTGWEIGGISGVDFPIQSKSLQGYTENTVDSVPYLAHKTLHMLGGDPKKCFPERHGAPKILLRRHGALGSVMNCPSTHIHKQPYNILHHLRNHTSKRCGF